MVEEVQLSKINNLVVGGSTDLDEIKSALNQILYVPNPLLKPDIIKEIISYLAS